MDQRGVTLVELMVALLLLTIALVGLAAAIPAGMLAITDAGLHASAAGLAQEPINQAKRTSFAALPGLAAARAAVPGMSGFDREVLVQDFAAPAGCLGGSVCAASCPTVGGAPTCRRVEVRVYFSGATGSIVVTLTTLRVTE